MALPTITGAKVRGGRYYLNLRIPPEAAAQYPGRTHLETSLKTADPQVARQGVILAQARLIELVRGAEQREVLAEAIANLPPDQRELLDEAGSVDRLQQQFDRAEKARTFLVAAGALTESDLLTGTVNEASERVSTSPHERAYLMPQPSKIAEKAIAADIHKAELAAFDRATEAEGKTLRAVGRKVKSTTAFGLRELIAALAPLTGVRSDTVALQNRIATRFIEFHGDLPLTDLTIGHLREFAEAYRGLPANLRSPTQRNMKFRDLLRATNAKDEPRIKDVTRKQHIDTLKGLLSKAPSQGYISADPWAQFGLIVPTGKHADAIVKPRLPFNVAQVKAVLEDAAKYDSTSIDRWGPLLAAYQGARIEEIAQLRGGDVLLEDGVWCMRITDAGEGQKVKNVSSVRTLPLHQKITEAGFIELAATRPADKFLFVHDSGEGLRPMKADKRGRMAPIFSKRFGNRLRKELKITDKRLTFHSFRHRWEDAAEDTDMPQTHRRDLAGRSKKGDSQANYGEGPRMAALKRSLDRIDPLTDADPTAKA